MKKGRPITLWCRACDTGYASRGEVPSHCPQCDQIPNWTTTPPYKLTVNDRRFLEMLRIDPEVNGA